MTLDKHIIQGIAPISAKTLLADDFAQLMVASGYTKIGSAPAKGNRVKAW